MRAFDTDVHSRIKCLRCRNTDVTAMDNTPFPMPGWCHCRSCNAIFPLDLALKEQAGQLGLSKPGTDPIPASA